MFTGSDTTATFLIVLFALGILAWGYNRARPYGKLGVIAWLQSVILIAPWLIFFSLFATGIYLNIVSILLLILISVGIYIYLGRKLRAEGQEAMLREQASRRLKEQEEVISTPQPTSTFSASEGQTEGNFTPEVIPIPEEDLNIIRGIFGIDTFFATETIPYQEGAIFKGNLRGETRRSSFSPLY